jgi:hypothetical protein
VLDLPIIDIANLSGTDPATFSCTLQRGGKMPQRGWNEKDERMYEHVKDSELNRGEAEDTAKEIAARTVNKQRREEGRTENVRTQGTGNPRTDYEARTKDELENIARERGIENYSRMTKDELIDALRD